MQAAPTLTVFMPTYNGERHVREAVESVLDNGFDDFELVVLDDGSTDATVAVLESIRHPALRLARNPRNLGVVETRRRGVELARGRYLALLDQDDLAVAGRFAAQVARLENAGGPDIVGGAVENFGDLSGVKQYYRSDAEIRAALLFNASISNPAACLRLAPLRGGIIAYDPAAGPAADYALWVDAMLAGLRLENLSQVVTRYRRHAASMTRTGLERMLETAAGVRRRVADAYFPQLAAAERAALVAAIGGRFASVEAWRDGLLALALAATAEPAVAGIERALLGELLAGRALFLIRGALELGAVNYELVEALTEESAAFERWRAAANGALDRRIMALFGY